VREAIYPCLKPTAEDTLAAPSSPAFVERIFSLCGLLSSGVRNQMSKSKSLEMSACLALWPSSDSRRSATVLLGQVFLQVCGCELAKESLFLILVSAYITVHINTFSMMLRDSRQQDEW